MDTDLVERAQHGDREAFGLLATDLATAREVIVLKRGSPVYATFDSEGRDGGDVRPAASCPALLQQVLDTGTQTVIAPNGLEPIEGTVELSQ